ncbi:MAG TPA: VWA domain-containing protein [Candidatus Babeliales bacterium]|nr:VWA domain-containing protein [Candidatus Babeliales bacterium]
MNIFSIIWGASDNLIVAPIVIIAGALLVYRYMRWNKAVTALAKQTSLMLRNASWIRQFLKALLLFIGLLFIFLALLKPEWNKKETIIEQEGRDLLIALDISRSMLAQDCKPNRLECAKQKIKHLVENLSCERVGLIVFSGSTFIQCPLTADYTAFYMFLDQIDVETVSSGTTAIDQAIKKALKAFSAVPERKTKLLVLFTDGEDFSSNLAGVKQEAAQEGLTIVTFGVGTSDGAPIPLVNEEGKQVGHQLDKKGNVVITHLNEGILRSLADDCGGIYITMSDTDADVKNIVAYVNRFEKEKLEDKKVSSFEEQYPYFIAVSFGCLAIEWLL